MGSRISAIIPTHGRIEFLPRAVESALSQSMPVHEVVVVVDGPDPLTERWLASQQEPRIRVVTRSSKSGDGGATARNAGVMAATGDIVSFLDDDDEWLPLKLETQLAYVDDNAQGVSWVVGGGVLWRDEIGETSWPTRGKDAAETVGHYLFVRQHAGEGWLPTTVLTCPRDVALRYRFREGLKQHVDYDWLLTLENSGVEILTPTRPVAAMHAPPGRLSVSESATWRGSLAWARSRRETLGPVCFSAFCLTEVSRRARATGSPLSFLAVLAAALTGEPRTYDLVRFVATWLIPARLMSVIRSRTRSRNQLRQS